jgi:F-type H+-transporting ATPase subunit b
MSQLISQLGIDWRLLLSQAVNFFLVLIVLRAFVYKPLLQMLRERRDRIQEGVTKAEEADRRLLAVDEMNRGKIKETEMQAIGILKRTETDAKTLEAKLMAEVKRKEAAELANGQVLLRAQEEASRRATEKEAVALVRQAIAKTVELSPEKIDDALIAKAIAEGKNGRPAQA